MATTLKQPRNLSPRMIWLRDYYFQGVKRKWNNEFTAWTTGTPWDFQYNELTFYIVPETYAFIQTFRSSFRQSARPVQLDPHFWEWSQPERRAWFVREVMVRYVPQEILPGDLLAGGRFNIMSSLCLPRPRPPLSIRKSTARRGRARPCCGTTTTATATPGPPAGTSSPAMPG
jgi:trans-4-hydroxy-L-proline dehydratase